MGYMKKKKKKIKNQIYYFFDDMINIENSDSNLPKIDQMPYPYKNIEIYYIGFVTMKDFDYVNIHVNMNIDEVDGSIEARNGK